MSFSLVQTRAMLFFISIGQIHNRICHQCRIDTGIVLADKGKDIVGTEGCVFDHIMKQGGKDGFIGIQMFGNDGSDRNGMCPVGFEGIFPFLISMPDPDLIDGRGKSFMKVRIHSHKDTGLYSEAVNDPDQIKSFSRCK